MAKYIDADKLLEKINEQKLMAREPAAKRIIGYINEVAAEDVTPVRHGQWEPIIDPCGKIEGWICKCGRESKEMSKFCPNCGAKMDDDEE